MIITTFLLLWGTFSTLYILEYFSHFIAYLQFIECYNCLQCVVLVIIVGSAVCALWPFFANQQCQSTEVIDYN